MAETMRRARAERGRDERGVALVLVVVLLGVLVGLLGLVIGLGFLATGSSRLQNIANVASIAAIEAYTKSGAAGYEERAHSALLRANEIIAANGTVPGVNSDFGELGLASMGGSDAGTLEFGEWRPKGSERCLRYPCFVPYDGGGSPKINAARVRIHSQEDNPLTAPFASFFGGRGEFEIKGSAVGILVPRCTAYLLDISGSTVAETHRGMVNYLPAMGSNPPWMVIGEPEDASLFAYLENRVCSLRSADECDQSYFDPGPPQCPGLTADKLFNCTMGENGLDRAGPGDHTIHFASDYRVSNSPYGRVYVDSYFESYSGYWGPQPLARYLLAFNAGLRAIETFKASGDRAMVYVFAGGEIDREPTRGSNGTPRLAQNFQTLIQLTNFNNRGLVDYRGDPIPDPVTGEGRVQPNAITRGWFPVPSSDTLFERSAQVGAIYDAIDALAYCPEGARKSIVMASDGVPNCAYNTDSHLSDCSMSSWEGYLAAEATALTALREDLISRDIALTVLIDSRTVGPNIKNVDVDDGAGYDFLSPERARGLGYCAVDLDGAGEGCPEGEFFDRSAQCPNGCQGGEQEAFLNLGLDQYRFRRPLGMWFQLAYDTAGVVCPIMPRCDELYPSDPNALYDLEDPNDPDGPRLIRNEFRAAHPIQDCAVKDLSKSEQAIACALGALGSNPFRNEEEEGELVFDGRRVP